MTGICVRWNDDVQPYVMQLASEHIETLREYCEVAVARILKSRKRKGRVLAVTALVNKSMLKAKAFHRFRMFGFDFELHEDLDSKLRRRAFVLSFTTPPNFKPEDMPPRLRRVGGNPLSAQPKRKRAKRGKRAVTKAGRGGKGTKKRIAERVLYRLRLLIKGIAARAAILASSVSAKLYKMYDRYQRLSARAAVMWRRRPTLRLSSLRERFLMIAREPWYAPIRARLEPRLIGESLGLLLFTFVSREQVEPWDVGLFGELPDEGERIAV